MKNMEPSWRRESNTFINESSLSRVYAQYKLHDSGTISGFRTARNCGSGEAYTMKEKINRNAILKAKLLSLGYGITAIDGVYIENFGSADAVECNEQSFIVIDLKDKKTLKADLKKLGTEFEQDSITFSEVNGDYYLIGTNHCPSGYPGYGKEIKLGKPLFGTNGEFYSKVKNRPFVFTDIDPVLADRKSSYKEFSQKHHVNEDFEEINNVSWKRTPRPIVTLTSLCPTEIRSILGTSEMKVE